MIDMKMSAEEKKDFSMPQASAPNYPYGLKIRLTPEELGKLGITEAPSIDDKMSFKIETTVCEVRKEENEGDEKGYFIELQITDMAKETKEKSASEALYGV